MVSQNIVSFRDRCVCELRLFRLDVWSGVISSISGRIIGTPSFMWHARYDYIFSRTPCTYLTNPWQSSDYEFPKILHFAFNAKCQDNKFGIDTDTIQLCKCYLIAWRTPSIDDEKKSYNVFWLISKCQLDGNWLSHIMFFPALSVEP